MMESGSATSRRIARTVFVTGTLLAIITFRMGLAFTVYPLYIMAFPSWLLLFVTPGYPELTGFEHFVVFVFASWLNGRLLGWLIWRFATIRKRRMTQRTGAYD